MRWPKAHLRPKEIGSQQTLRSDGLGTLEYSVSRLELAGELGRTEPTGETKRSSSRVGLAEARCTQFIWALASPSEGEEIGPGPSQGPLATPVLKDGVLFPSGGCEHRGQGRSWVLL